MGFSGVQNFPTVGLFDGNFRQNLEETGMGYDLEVEMIRLAASATCSPRPTSSTSSRRIAMTRAGADVLVPHMGLTTAGTIGATTAVTLDDSVRKVQEMRDAAVAENPDVIVLCHGGPIAEPEDARTSSRTPPAWPASSAPPPRSACPPNVPSRPRSSSSRRSARLSEPHTPKGTRMTDTSTLPTAKHDPESVPTRVFDWGTIKWLVTPRCSPTGRALRPAGDIVLTQAGDSHDVVEVYEDLRGFFVETGHPRVDGRGTFTRPTRMPRVIPCRRLRCLRLPGAVTMRVAVTGSSGKLGSALWSGSGPTVMRWSASTATVCPGPGSCGST